MGLTDEHHYGGSDISLNPHRLIGRCHLHRRCSFHKRQNSKPHAGHLTGKGWNGSHSVGTVSRIQSGFRWVDREASSGGLSLSLMDCPVPGTSVGQGLAAMQTKFVTHVVKLTIYNFTIIHFHCSVTYICQHLNNICPGASFTFLPLPSTRLSSR